jgi:hypothetical protein
MKSSDWGEVQACLEGRDVMRGQLAHVDAAILYLESMQSLTPDEELVGTQLRQSYHVNFDLPLISITAFGVQVFDSRFDAGYNDNEDGVLLWREATRSVLEAVRKRIGLALKAHEVYLASFGVTLDD